MWLVIADYIIKLIQHYVLTIIFYSVAKKIRVFSYLFLIILIISLFFIIHMWYQTLKWY